MEPSRMQKEVEESGAGHLHPIYQAIAGRKVLRNSGGDLARGELGVPGESEGHIGGEVTELLAARQLEIYVHRPNGQLEIAGQPGGFERFDYDLRQLFG